MLAVRRFGALFALVLLTLSLACRDPESGNSPDAGTTSEVDGGYAYPAPRTDLVPEAGSETTLDIATWNIENFPKNAGTPSVVADLIASLDLDIVAIQEVEDTVAFDELVARLRGYEGLVSSHTYGDGSYQKVGYVYKSSLVQLSGAYLLFDQNGYEFPRPALKVDVSLEGELFTLVTLHLKAGGSFNDRSRREAAVGLLMDYLQPIVDAAAGAQYLVAGDFNATAESAALQPIIGDSSRYTLRTQGNANGGDYSYVPSGSLIDHLISTKGFDENFGMGTTIVPRLDDQMLGYVGQVSDHLPVVTRLPMPQ